MCLQICVKPLAAGSWLYPACQRGALAWVSTPTAPQVQRGEAGNKSFLGDKSLLLTILEDRGKDGIRKVREKAGEKGG